MADTGLNSTAAALLGLLHEGPKTGGDLVAEAQSRFGSFWTVTRSQVYRELPELAGRGYLKAGKPGTRSAQPYAITAAGRRAFAGWLTESVGREHHRSPLLLRTAFAGRITAEHRRTLFADERAVHEQTLAALREQLKESKGADRFSRATLDFAITYERALLRWIDTTSS